VTALTFSGTLLPDPAAKELLVMSMFKLADEHPLLKWRRPLKIGGYARSWRNSVFGICVQGRLGNRLGSRPVISATLRHRVHFIPS
jgi:hypothetical protein